MIHNRFDRRLIRDIKEDQEEGDHVQKKAKKNDRITTIFIRFLSQYAKGQSTYWEEKKKRKYQPTHYLYTFPAKHIFCIRTFLQKIKPSDRQEVEYRRNMI